MRCLQESDLIAVIVAPSDVPVAHRDHVEACASCQSQMAHLRQILELVADSNSFADQGPVADSNEDSHQRIVNAASGSYDGLSSDSTAFHVGGDQPFPLAAPVLGVLGDYQIIRELGRGGMGIVYEATQISLNKRVAVKVLPLAGALDQRGVQRFQNEVRAASLLQHPHIVPIYAVGCERGTHYYAMQYVEGCTLARVIADMRKLHVPADKRRPDADTTRSLHSASPLDDTGLYFENHPQSVVEPEATPNILSFITTRRSASDPEFFRAFAQLGMQMADAVQHAHDCGVTHRDIKPSNLLLDRHAKVWLTDFGLAQVVGEPSLTNTGHHVGTVRYMAPEQALPNDVVVDSRADVYSLGVTLYELLTMRPACDGDTRPAILHQLAFEDPPAPRKLNPRVPRELETILLKAISKRPDERYQTARQMAEDLQCFLKDEPIRSRPPTPVQRLERWARKHKSVVTSGAGIVTACALFFGIASALLVSAWGQERAARESAEDLLRQTQASRLAIRSALERDSNPGLALGLATEARQLHESAEINNAVLAALDANHERKTLFEHKEPVRTVSWSRIGLLVTTASPSDALSPSREPAIVWDAESGTVRQRLQEDRAITSATLSPNGRRVLTSTAPHRAAHATSDSAADVGKSPVLWDTVGGDKQLELQDAFLMEARAENFSPDGRLVVAPMRGNRVGVYDVLGDGTAARTLEGHTDRVNSATFSPRGTYVVSTSRDKTVRVWDTATGREIRKFERWREFAPESAVFSPDERLLATASGEGAHLWQLDLEQPLNADTHWPGSLVLFSPLGDKLLVAQRFGESVRAYRTGRIPNAGSPPEIFRIDVTGGTLNAMNIAATGNYFALLLDREVHVHFLDDGSRAAVLRGHTDTVLGVALDSEGLRLASVAADQSVRLWDVLSSRDRNRLPLPLADSPQGALSPQGSVAMVTTRPAAQTFLLDSGIEGQLGRVGGAFDRDGRAGNRLVTHDGSRAAVWDWTTQQEQASWQLPRGEFRRVRLSRDGRWAVAVIEGEAAWLWNLETNVRTKMDSGSEVSLKIRDAAFNEQSDYLATAGADGVVRLYRSPFGETAAKELAMDGDADHVEFSPDGRRLLASAAGSSAVVWNVETPGQGVPLSGPDHHYSHAKFSSDGAVVITYDHRIDAQSHSLQAWDSASGQLLRQIEAPRVTYRVSLAKDRQELVVASARGLIWWNFATGDSRNLTERAMAFATFNGAERIVAFTFVADDPQTIDAAAPLPPPEVQLWELGSGRLVKSIPNRLGSVLLNDHVESLPDGRLLVSAHRFGAAVVNLDDGKRVAIEGGSTPIASLAFSPDGQTAATGSLDGTTALWHVTDGRLLHLLPGEAGPVLSLAFSPHHDELATAGSDGRIQLWRASTGEHLRTLEGHKDLILQVLYESQQNRLVSNSRDGTVRFWNHAGETVHVITSRHGMYKEVAISLLGRLLAVPDGKATAKADPQVQGATTQEPEASRGAAQGFAVEYFPSSDAAAQLLRLESAPFAASFSRDGQFAATSDSHGKTTVWALGKTPQPTRVIQQNQVSVPRFSPNGEFLLLAQTERLSIWNLNSGKEVATYTDCAGFLGEPGRFPATYSADGRWVMATTRHALGAPKHALFFPTDTLDRAQRAVPRELTAAERATHVSLAN